MSLATTIKTLCAPVLAAGVAVGIAGCGREEPPDEPAWDQPSPTQREQPAQPAPPRQEDQEDSTEESPRYDLGE